MARIGNYPPEMEADKWVGFIPVVNSSPKVLSQRQIQSYNERGFIHGIRGVFTEAEVDRNRVRFDKLLAQAQACGRDENAINGYHTKLSSIWELATDPRLLDIVSDLIDAPVDAASGEKSFCCVMTNYLCKLPGTDKHVPWHQDAVYWPFDRSRIVQIYLAIDDQDEENSAMRMIEGSHLLGKLDWALTEDAAALQARGTARVEKANGTKGKGLSKTGGLFQEIIGAEELGLPVFSNNLKAGELSIFSDMTAHSSAPNATSSRRRCSIILRYVPVDVRAFDLGRAGERRGWNDNTILVRGADPSGHWAQHPRPLHDDFARAVDGGVAAAKL